MYSVCDTPKGWVAPFGHPGIKACSRLPRDFRSVPRPSSPPGAKASTRCPSHTQTKTHHAQEPSTPHDTHASQHTHKTHQSPQSHSKPTLITQHTFQTPLNTAAILAIGTMPPPQEQHSTPGQTPMPAQPRTPTHNPEPTHTIGARGQSHPRCPAHPETHQNLIHNQQRTTRTPGHAAILPRFAGGTWQQARSLGAAQPTPPEQREQQHTLLRDDDVGNTTGEATSLAKASTVVEADGIEPTTPCLQSRCSPT